MDCTRMPRLAPAGVTSRATCTQSSRGGATTKACGTPSPPSVAGRTRCSSGTPKPRVLPVPVRAWPIRSCPASASGRVSSWIAKVRVMPASASAATTSGWTSKSLNRGLSSFTGAPPSSSTDCSICSGSGAPVSACSRSACSAATGVGLFSMEVSALASGLLGDRLRRRDPPLRTCPGSVVAGSVPAPTRPAETGPHRNRPGRQLEKASSSGRQRTDTQANRTARRFPCYREDRLASARRTVDGACPARQGQVRPPPPGHGTQEERVTSVDRRAVAGPLGVLAYAELTAFDRLAEDARLAPKLTGRAALARMAAAEIAHHVRLTDRLAQLGVEPADAMAPFVSALDTFHESTPPSTGLAGVGKAYVRDWLATGFDPESTRPSTWLEGLVKAYVGDGLATDFYREVATFLPDPDRRLVLEVLADTGHADFAVREVRAAIAADRKVAGRLSLWGRRLVGEAITRSQAVIAEHDRLAELIIAGTGDLAGVARLIERITDAHTQRMKALGLNP